MSNFLKKNEKRLTSIIAISLAVILVAMIAWIAIDKFLSVSPYFEDQTFAAALADGLDKTARFLDEKDIEKFEVMVVSCYVQCDASTGYQALTIPYVTLGYADYADYIIENTRTMNEEKEEEEEKEESAETSDTSETSKDEGPKFDTVQVYATPSTIKDIVKFANLRVLSVIDSSTAYDISYNVYMSSMYSQLLGTTSNVSASAIYNAIVPDDLTSLKDLSVLTNLEYLGVAYSHISNLEGIENFPKLVAFDATTCKLTSVAGVENASELIALYLGSNTLSAIDGVEKLEKLETLDVSSNKLEKLPAFKADSKLTNLSLSSNKLEKLDVDLKTLYADGNVIKELTVVSPVLETLNLADNKLVALDALKDLTTLETLDLSGNGGIIDISPLAGMTKLTALGLKFTEKNPSNKLINIEALKDMTELETLTISYTGVKDLAPLANLTKLTSLTVTNSAVESTAALEKLTKLTTIDLSVNKISDVSGLKNKKELTSLNLTDNMIKDISALKGAFDVEKIKTLNFKDNMITDWKPLEAYTKATITKDNNSKDKTDKNETSKDETSGEVSEEVSEEVSKTETSK